MALLNQIHNLYNISKTINQTVQSRESPLKYNRIFIKQSNHRDERCVLLVILLTLCSTTKSMYKMHIHQPSIQNTPYINPAP